VLSYSFAKLYDVLVVFFSYLTLHSQCTQILVAQSSPKPLKKSTITPPIGTPKDVNDQLRQASGLDPDNPNDMAFKLVTILIFFLCHKKSLFSFSKSTICSPPPPPRIGLSTIMPPPPCVPL
jgi:hypothetical protein